LSDFISCKLKRFGDTQSERDSPDLARRKRGKDGHKGVYNIHIPAVVRGKNEI